MNSSSADIYCFIALKFNGVGYRGNNGEEGRLSQEVFLFHFARIRVFGVFVPHVYVERIELAVCVVDAHIPSAQVATFGLFVEVYPQVQSVIIAVPEIVARFHISVTSWELLFACVAGGLD